MVGDGAFGLLSDGGGWLRDRDKELEKQRGRERSDIYFYIILLCRLYYFNVLYVKNKIWMLSVL